MAKISSNTAGWLMGLGATLIWGCHYSVNRFIFGVEDHGANLLTVSFWKWFIGAAVLVPALFLDHGWQKCKQALQRDWPMMLVMALFGTFLESTLMLVSSNWTTAARGSLLCNLSPLFTVILAAILLRKMPSRRCWMGMFLGLAGLAMAFFSQGVDQYTAPNQSTFLGDAMAVLSGLAWAIYTVIGGKYALKYGGVPCTFIMLIMSCGMILPCCLVQKAPLLPSLPLSVWCSIFFIGAAVSGVGVALWYAALARVQAAALGSLGYLSAAIAMVLAKFAANEHFTILFGGAIAAIVAALWMLMDDPPQKEHPTN